MTAHKPGTVTQQPMYGCTGCYELRTFHASDLRVHGDECWCYLCWDVYKEAELGIEYADLPAYDPSPQPTPCVGCEGAKEALDMTISKELWELAEQRKEHRLSEHKKRHKEKQEKQELIKTVQDLQKEVMKLTKAVHKMMENPDYRNRGEL